MIRSMTGFGAGHGASGDEELDVEVRSVNHKFLEVKVRAPRELGALSDALVELLGAIPRARALGRAARARMESAFTEAARGEAVAAFLARILSLPPAGRAA